MHITTILGLSAISVLMLFLIGARVYKWLVTLPNDEDDWDEEDFCPCCEWDYKHKYD